MIFGGIVLSLNNVGYKYEKRSGYVRNGETSVKYTLSVPEFFCDGQEETYDRINSVYRDILENCLSFCQNGIDKCFEANELIYRLDCRVTYGSEDIVCVTVEAVVEERREADGVYRGARRIELQRYFRGDIWERGALLPPKIALSRFLPKGKRAKRVRKKDSVMVDGDGVYLIKNDTNDRVRIEPE